MSARRNGNRARCQHEGCEKFAQTRGLCKAHGGGSRCRDPSCNKLAQSRGLCIAHGGGRRCQHEGCSKLAQSKGFCISHGGGRRCTVPNCEKFSQVKGRCKSHSKLAETSDHEEVDESGSDRTMASPSHLRVRSARHAHHHTGAAPPPPQRSHPSDAQPSRHVDYRGHILPSLHQRHARDPLTLPSPRSFGLIPHNQPRLPPHEVMQAVSNREHRHDEPAAHQSRVHHWDESHKQSGSHPSSQAHLAEDLPPLPYTYNLPTSRPMYDVTEEKQRSEDQNYTLLPSRFMQAHPSIAPPTGTLPTVSSMMATSASAVASNAPSSHDHFIGHRHAEPVATVEPTSIPLLSFLDRSKEATITQSNWASSSITTSTAATTSIVTSMGSTASSRQSDSPPNIVLPPLKHNQQNPR